jgi:hypothetical protein
MIAGIIYLGLGCGFFIYVLTTYVYFRLKIRRSNLQKNQEKKAEETNDNSETASTLPTARFSYKKNLTIQIPGDDSFVNLDQSAFIVKYFKENCFPLSQKFLKSEDLKILKTAKWFLTVCCEITISLYILNNFTLISKRTDFYIVCSLASCTITLVLSTILALLFTKTVRLI